MGGVFRATSPKTAECITFLSLLKESNSMEAQAAASLYFRKRMTATQEPLGELAEKVTSELIDCLKRWGNQEVQLNAAWALTNIACRSMEDTHRIVDMGGVQALADLAKNSTGDTQDQAVWALGNVAADCAQCRSHLRSSDLLDALVGFYRSAEYRLPRRRATLTWCIVNILRNGVPNLSILTLHRIVGAMHDSLLLFIDDKLLCDAVWSIAFAIDQIEDNGQRIDVVLREPGLAQKLISLLKHENRTVRSGALRAVGNIVTGTDLQTTTMIDLGVLPELLPLLSLENSQCVREALWILGNITAGPEEHVESVFKLPYIGAKILKNCRHPVMRIRKEGFWLVVNALTNARDKLLEEMIGGGLFAVPVDILTECPADEALVERTLSMLIHNLRRSTLGEYVALTLRFTEIASPLRDIQAFWAAVNPVIVSLASDVLQMIFPNGVDDPEPDVQHRPLVVEIDRRSDDEMQCE